MRPHLLVLVLFLCSTVLTTDGRLQARDSAASNTPTNHPYGTDEDALSETWVIQYGADFQDSANGVVVDSLGNVFSAGYVRDSSFKEWAYLSAHDSSGTEQCITEFGYSSTAHERAEDIAVDSQGNIYIVGFTTGFVIEAWLTKYDLNCQEQWSFFIAPESVPLAVAIDTSDNIYVGGRTTGDLAATNAGGQDAWLAKHNTNGNQIWVEQFGTTSNDTIRGIAFDSTGDIYVTGRYGSGIEGSRDLWLARYNSDGSLDWYETLGTSKLDYGTGIAIDDADNVFVTGLTQGGLDGPGSGSNDAFVARYDSAGNKQWVRQFGPASSNDIAFSSTTGNVYLTGSTSADLGDNDFMGGLDAFIASYAIDGTKAWVHRLGTTAVDQAQSIAIGQNNEIVIAGNARGDWGTGSNLGMFVAKLEERLPEVRIEATTPGVSVDDVEQPVGVKHPLLSDEVVRLVGGEASALIDVDCLINLLAAAKLLQIRTGKFDDRGTFLVGTVLIASLEICAKKAAGPAVLSATASETPPMELALQEGSLLFEVEEALLHLHVETANATVQSLGGNDFEVAYDPTMDKTTITAYSGSVTVVPSNPALEPFGLGPFEQVVIDDSSTGPIQSIGSILYLPFVQK